MLVLACLLDIELRRMQRIDLSALCSSTRSSPDQQVLVAVVSGRVLAGGHLSHVLAVFERFGFSVDTTSFPANGSHSSSPRGREFDVLWTHEYPFRLHDGRLRHLRPGQLVNHFPGSGFITSKVQLAVSAGGEEASAGRIRHVPRSFRLPRDAETLRQFALTDPSRLFVQKSNSHRNIHVRPFQQLDLQNSSTFVQEFVSRPLLIDGYKFDIGVYAVLTSVDPLRVYVYDGDVLLRFCTQRYHPFSSDREAAYVVGDDYLPTWKVPALSRYYSEQRLGHRGSLNAHLRDRGLSSRKLWSQVDAAIRSVYTSQESALRRAIEARHGAGSGAGSSLGHYFELVRFDFLVDESLSVYLLEANMSPNLSSRKHPANRLLYEQLLYSVFSVVGAAGRTRPGLHHARTGPAAEMRLSEQQLAVLGRRCGSSPCSGAGEPLRCSGLCRVCLACLSAEDRSSLLRAAREHFDRHQCRRLLPDLTLFSNSSSLLLHQDDDDAEWEEDSWRLLEQLSPTNQLQHIWFRAKCLTDRSWC